MKKRNIIALVVVKVSIFIVLSVFLTRYINTSAEDPIWFGSISSITDVEREVERSKPEKLDVYSNDGFTGLMFAAKNTKKEIAKLLISKGVNLNLRSKNKKSKDSLEEKDTALHLAIRGSDDDDGNEIAKMILKNKLKPDLFLENRIGNKPIHEIVDIDDADRRIELLKLFVLAKADLNVVNYEGNTLVHLSVEQNSPDWIKKLGEEFGWKQHGGVIDLGIKNNENYTPLDMAKDLGFTDLLKELENKYKK